MEFLAWALRGLCHRIVIKAFYIEPGKPCQNDFAQRFHVWLRDEFSNSEVFFSVTDAQVRLNS